MKNFFFKNIIILLFIFFSSNCVIAQDDHLVPETGIFNTAELKYYTKVRKTLFKDTDYTPIVRFLVIPAFLPEKVIDIKYNVSLKKYFLSYHKANKSIWYKKFWEGVKVDKKRKEISKNSVELTKDLFRAALSKTKHADTLLVGFDGADYHFSLYETTEMSMGGHILKTGMVWSPPKNTKMDRLISIGEKLIKLTESNDDVINFDDNFIWRLKKLTIEIKKE